MSCCINPHCISPQNNDDQLFCQSCGSELLLEGRYRVNVPLGEGGFGKTYEVSDASGTVKVLKVLNSIKPKWIELFQREAQVLAQLSNPGIPSVESNAYFTLVPKDSEEPLHCLVMEKIVGLDLKKYIEQRGKPIGQSLAVQWLIELLQILQVVHAQQFLHRDIKPSNIMLKSKGGLALIDFGAVWASSSTSEPGNNGATQIISALYTPNEQMRGEPKCPQSDFFALGRTFVYLLTARDLSTLYLAAQDELCWRDAVPNLLPRFANFLDRLMAPLHTQRPASDEVLLQQLADIQQDLAEQDKNGSSGMYLVPRGERSLGALPNQDMEVISPASIREFELAESSQNNKSDPKQKENATLEKLFPVLLVFVGLSALAVLSLGFFSFLGRNSSSTSGSTHPKLSDVPNVPQGIFNYGGSTTFSPLRSREVIQQISQTFPKFQLRYTEPLTGNPGSGKGIEMLIDGQLSIAQSSRPVKDEEYAKAKNRGFTLDAVPIGIDGIAVFLNPALAKKGIKNLRLDQVRNIFIGKTQNWKQIGGPDVKISPFSRNKNAGGTVDFFIENVLEKKPLGSIVQEVRDTTEAVRKVASEPGGISYASTSESIKQQTIHIVSLAKGQNKASISPCGDPACTTINVKAFSDASYPITRRLFVIIKRDQRLDEQAGVAYANMLLSDEGQQLAKQAGFVPIR